MRPVLLLARSRHLAGSASAIVLLNLGGLLITSAQIERPGSEGGVPWVLFLPLLTACIVGLSMWSPMSDYEQLASRPFVWLRLCHISLLLAPAFLLLTLVGNQLGGVHTGFSANRNLFGLVGVALIGARVLGAKLSWLPPLLWSMIAAALGDPRSVLPAWDWLVRPDVDYQASLIAWLLGFVGVVAGINGSGTTSRLRTCENLGTRHYSPGF